MKQLFSKIGICFFAFLFCFISVHAQQFKWVQGGGSIVDFSTYNSWEKTNYMCTDANGNIYAVSQVGYTDITVDTFFAAMAYAPSNLMITSYNCNGQLRWTKLITTTSSGGGDGCIPFGLVADGIGHIYIAGVMAAATLYIGFDTAITGLPDDLTGVIQLDTSGHFNWIQYIGNNTLSTYIATATNIGALAIDNSNNVHFLPYIGDGAILMPGVTSHYGVYDMVYDAAGTLLSATRLGFDSAWAVNSAVIDPATNKLYVSGQINQFIYGSPIPLTDTFFAAAFATDRSLLWQYFCGHGDDDAVVGVVIDQAKYLYFCGNAQPGIGLPPPTTFSFNGDSVQAPGFFDMSVIMKTDTNGIPQWITHYDGNSNNSFLGLTLLPGNLLAATGYLFEEMYSDVGNISAGVGSDPFFAVVDTSGDLMTFMDIHGDGPEDEGTAITSDQAGNIYIGGCVSDSIPSSIIPAYHTVGGNTDFFVMKYGVDCSCTSGPISAYTDTGIHRIGVTYTGTTTGLDSVVWRFGDGGTGTGITAYHTYTLASTYRVCGIVYTACGSDIYCTNVTILCGLPPVASFTKTGTHTLAVTYTGTTSTVDSVGWIFGDGFRDTGATITHTYTATGTYHVCAVAHSMCGNDTACKYDTVVCIAPPVASFSHSGTVTIDATYTGTTTGVDSIGWLFGDGSRGSGTTSSHTYTTPGTYDVCVVAHSTCGNDTVCHADTVLCVSPPVASFNDTGIITIGTTYTGTTIAIDSIVWNFGDGSGTVTGVTAIHIYSAIGIYHVCVTAYSPCGSNTACKYDTVLCVTPPVASFTDTGTHIVGFSYTGTTADVDSIVWSFGDGHTSTSTTPVHTYTASGTYHVCVTTYTGCGIDSVCRDITVHVPNSVSVINAHGTIKVFPNPANDELNITGLIESTTYRLLTIAGTCVLHGSLQQPTGNISMQNIVPGVYVLELTGLDGARDMVRVVKE